MKNPCIEPYDIMPIISYSWDKSFAVVESNEKTIVERGWYPYNQNLMTYPEIRASITKEEAENELLNTSKIVLPLQKRVEITDLTNSSPQVIDKRFAAKPIPDEKKKTTSQLVWPHSASTNWFQSMTSTKLGQGSSDKKKMEKHWLRYSRK